MRKRTIRPGIIYLVISFIVLLIFIYAPIFTLREIRADGMRFLTNEDIVTICSVPYGTALFSVETDEISKRLLSDLRIEEAVVRRSLPCYIDISIKERLPLATVSAGSSYLAVDKEGRIIDAYSAPKPGEIPNIAGIAVKDVFIGDDIKDDKVKAVLDFLSRLDESSLKTIKEIEVNYDGSVLGKTITGMNLRLGDLSDADIKARLTMNFFEDIKKNPVPVEYVDFKFNAPFIKIQDDVSAAASYDAAGTNAGEVRE